MKIAICADLHLRGSDLEAVRRQLFDLVAKSDDCDLLCVCGDLFDRPSIGDAHASTGAIAEVAIEAVAAFACPNRHALLLCGNHDYSGVGSADALHIFDGMAEVTVVRDPGLIEMFGLRIAVMPWKWSAPPECLEASDCDLFLAHLRIGGAMMGPVVYEERQGDFCVSRSWLEKVPAKHIALGDFHKRQDLTGRGGYVGALRQMNWGEEGNPQGFEILDTETWQSEWVELSQCPCHFTVSRSPGEVVQPKANVLLRVRYSATPDPDEVRDLENKGIVVQQIVEREERVRRAEVPHGVLQDNRELIRLWAGSQEPPVEGARLEAMLTKYGAFE